MSSPILARSSLDERLAAVVDELSKSRRTLGELKPNQTPASWPRRCGLVERRLEDLARETRELITYLGAMKAEGLSL